MADRAVGTGRVLPTGIAGGPGAGNPQPIVVGGVSIRSTTVRSRGAARANINAGLNAPAWLKSICRIAGIATDNIHIHKVIVRR